MEPRIWNQKMSYDTRPYSWLTDILTRLEKSYQSEFTALICFHGYTQVQHQGVQSERTTVFDWGAVSVSNTRSQQHQGLWNLTQPPNKT